MVGGRTLLEKVERRRAWLGILWTVCLELATEPSSSREENLTLLVHPGPVHPFLGEVTCVHVVLQVLALLGGMDAFYSRTTPQCWASAPASSFPLKLVTTLQWATGWLRFLKQMSFRECTREERKIYFLTINLGIETYPHPKFFVLKVPEMSWDW